MARKASTATRTTPLTPEERGRLEAAMRLIARSAASRPRLPDLAEAAGQSKWHFLRRFKLCFGETPLQATARHQVEKAKRLMLEGAPLAKVARKTGFSNQSHFCSRFKQMTGTTPTGWLRGRCGRLGPRAALSVASGSTTGPAP
jgi:AraC-like DNA-binding protein